MGIGLKQPKWISVQEFSIFINQLLHSGSKPKETKGTMVRLIVANDKASAGNDVTEWRAYLQAEKGSNMEIVIIPSTTALVGSYSICTKVRCKDLSEEKTRFVKEEQKEKLIVLFNPWCKGMANSPFIMYVGLYVSYICKISFQISIYCGVTQSSWYWEGCIYNYKILYIYIYYLSVYFMVIT